MSTLNYLMEEMQEAAGITEARKSKKATPKETFKVGDKVAITLQGLQAHSRSTPASMGYSNATINWRKQLSDRKGKPATVTRVFPSGSLNIEYPDGYLVQVYGYMVEKV